MKTQITTLSFFTTSGVKNNFWAFTQVIRAPRILANVEGLLFIKSMGSGAGKGFDIMPSFSNYCWLMVWENESIAREFLKTNIFFLEYSARCSNVSHLILENVESHGRWSNKQPFQKASNFKNDSTVVVLTRAKIKLSKLLQFWLKVGKTANKLYQFPELKFSIGVGEYPLIQQATISIWENQQAMLNYAYKDENHKQVIKLTRQYKWYSEELFARFSLKDSINMPALYKRYAKKE